MDPPFELVGQQRVDEALSLDEAQPRERGRYDEDVEVRLAARPRTAMAGVPGAIVLDLKDVGGEGRFQLVADQITDGAH